MQMEADCEIMAKDAGLRASYRAGYFKPGFGK
jgi:hypothetical protein